MKSKRRPPQALSTDDLPTDEEIDAMIKAGIITPLDAVTPKNENVTISTPHR